ncbi:hypothetical protein [Lacunimicrobium album]
MFFELIHSTEEKRPEINFSTPTNSSIDWEEASAVIVGDLPLENYVPLHISIKSKSYDKWHGYLDGGMGGMFSADFIDSWDDDEFEYYSFLPVFLNASVYYFLRRNQLVDCLDRDRSNLLYYKSNPSEIMTINAFAFTSTAPKYRFFSIPEYPLRIFASQELQARFQRNPFKGVAFVPLLQK